MDDDGCVLFIELLLQVSLSVPGMIAIKSALKCKSRYLKLFETFRFVLKP